MQEYISEFILHIAHERRLSKHTVIAYQKDLENFYNWCQVKLGTKEPIKFLDHYHVREYLSNCCHKLKNISIARKLSALRSFFRYLVRAKKIISSPLAMIENPKVPKSLPKPVNVDEAFSLCSGFDTQDPKSFRDRLITELLYASGLRVSELCSLDLDSVDLKKSLIQVMGKGKKERIIPIHYLCTQLITTWVTAMRAQFVLDAQEPALFLGERGRRINPRVVRAIVHRLGISRDCLKRVHPHRFRHAYATHMLESGADLKAIQELLGHESIATTERYTEIDLVSLMKHYDQAHPLARKRS